MLREISRASRQRGRDSARCCTGSRFPPPLFQVQRSQRWQCCVFQWHYNTPFCGVNAGGACAVIGGTFRSSPTLDTLRLQAALKDHNASYELRIRVKVNPCCSAASQVQRS